MFAVIKTGGRQYRVVPDDVLEIGKIAGDVGTIVQLGEVLVLGGDTPVLGVPTVAGASVAAEVLDHKRGPKVIAFKKRRRKNSQAQARLSRRDHGDAHHRDPGRRQGADHRPAPKREKPVVATPVDGDEDDAEGGEEKGAGQEGRWPRQGRCEAAAKPDAKKAPAEARGQEGQDRSVTKSEMISSRN